MRGRKRRIRQWGEVSRRWEMEAGGWGRSRWPLSCGTDLLGARLFPQLPGISNTSIEWEDKRRGRLSCFGCEDLH